MAIWSVEGLPLHPYETMHIMLRSVRLKQVTLNINSWFYIVMCNPTAQRPPSPEICARLASYLQDLMPLMEAMYFHYKFVGVSFENPTMTKEEVLKELDFSELYWLKKSDALDPLPVLKSFAQRYSQAFIQRIMGNILESIDGYDGPIFLDKGAGEIRQNWSIAHVVAEAAHAISFHLHYDLEGKSISPVSMAN